MSIIGSLINGGFTLGAAGMARKTARKQLEQEQKFNAEQAQLNRDYQTSEREATQAYNTGEREAAQAYNTSEREATQAYNTSEREAAQQWNLDMWNRENEYNDPRAQMERMVAAGINPNAVAQGMAGSGSTAGSVAASSGASSTPGHSSGASSSPGSGSVATTPSIASFLGENVANSVNSLWQNLYNQEQIESARLDNAMKDKELGVFDVRFNLESEEIQARIDEINKGIEEKDADIKLKKQQFDFLEEMNPIQLQTANTIYQKTAAEIRQIDQQVENLKKQYQLTEEQIKNVQADTSKKEAETELIGAQQDLTESEKALTDVRTLIEQKNNIIKDLEVSAAEQGISFTGPEFYSLYEFERRTGKNAAAELMRPTMRVERRRAWRGVGTNLVSKLGEGVINAGASWISNPLFGRRSSRNYSNSDSYSYPDDGSDGSLMDFFNR